MRLEFTMLLRGRFRDMTACVNDEDGSIEWIDADGIAAQDLEPEEREEISIRVQDELDTEDDIEAFKARRDMEAA